MNYDLLVGFIQDLVRRPSLSGEEAAVAERVEEMVSLGYDRVELDAYGTVVGVIEGALPGRTLLFDGHTDTVGVTSGVPWTRDPYSGTLEKARFTGAAART